MLFVCSRNRLRSPTAEQVFAHWPGIQVASAGLDHDAENPVVPELLQWADLVLVMEPVHRRRLQAKFRAHLGRARVAVLGIPDEYAYMDATLVALLEQRVAPYLR